MNDPLDDLLNMRLAGHFDADLEHTYPPEKWAADAVIVSSVTVNDDGSTYMSTNDYHAIEFGGAHPHAAQPGHMPSVADVVAERDQLRQIVAALVAKRPIVYDPDGSAWCHHCEGHVSLNDSGIAIAHAPDCPWRLAKEYVEAHRE